MLCYIVCSGDRTESTTTASTAAVSTFTGTEGDHKRGRQQGVSTTLIGKMYIEDTTINL